MGRFIPNCRDMTRLASKGLDEAHPWHLRVRMAIHLMLCQLCRRYARQLRLLHCVGENAHEANHSHGVLPEDGRNRLKAALKRELATNLGEKAE